LDSVLKNEITVFKQQVLPHPSRPTSLFLFAILLFSLCGKMYSQQEGGIRIETKYSKLTAIDTNYIYKYNSRLVVGPCLSYRNYNIVLHPQVAVDSVFIPNLKWRSPSNRFWGIDFSYDKFGFTFSFSSVAPKSEREEKGESSSSSFGFTYGGNRCFVDASVRTFQGFYEMNSMLYDSTLTSYYQSPSLSSVMLNIKVWYFTNHHKFAFKSAYGGLYRQLKSQMTFAFSGNLHTNTINTDSSIVPDPDKTYFDNVYQIKTVACAGISIFAGVAANIIIKQSYFINFAYLAGPDFQGLSTYTNFSETPTTKYYTNYAHDIRFATGFNKKNWYFTFTLSHELNRFNNDLVIISGRLNSYSLNLGYRFSVKEPKLYKKFQNTWLYSAF
jgi:hypothetical protein